MSMKRMYPIAAAVSLLLTVAPVFSATSYATPAGVTYRTYRNRGWGYSVAVPSSWREGPRAGDGDGRDFYAPSGDSQFDNGQYSHPPSHDVMVAAFGMINVVPPLRYQDLFFGISHNQMLPLNGWRRIKRHRFRRNTPPPNATRPNRVRRTPTHKCWPHHTSTT